MVKVRVDTTQLISTAKNASSKGEDLLAEVHGIRSQVGALVGQGWIGADGRLFQERQEASSRMFTQVAESFLALGERLRASAGAYEQTEQNTATSFNQAGG